MQINLEIEQINNIVAATLMADYRRILSGEYSDCVQFLPAFEQLFEFYLSGSERAAFMQDLTPSQKREMMSYIVN